MWACRRKVGAMAEALKLKASCAGVDSTGAGEQALTIAQFPAEVTIEVTVASATTSDKVTVTDENGDVVGVTYETPADAATASLTFKGKFQLAADANVGRYIVAADGSTAVNLTITKAQTDVDGGTPGSDAGTTVVDVTPGELDNDFLIGTGLVAAALLAFVIFAFSAFIRHVSVAGTHTQLKVGDWVSGTGAEVIAGVIQVGTLAAGSVLIIVGGWLATVEARGRLRRKLIATVVGGSTAERGLITDAGNAASSVIESLKSARGTIAVLSVGAILILGALIASAQVASNSHGPESPAPTETPTGSPAGTPTGEPTETGPGAPTGTPSETDPGSSTETPDADPGGDDPGGDV